MQDIDYAELNRRIDAALEERKKAMHGVLYFISSAIFLVLLIIGWILFADAGESLAGMIMMTVGGGLMVLLNGLALAAATGRMDKDLRRDIMRREIDVNVLEMMLEQAREKQKRDGQRLDDSASEDAFLGVSDDGELLTQRRRDSR